MNKVSLVVPVYNMGDKIEKCVQSLIDQTYKNIEIILVDDGSKDDSFDNCLKFKDKDKRVKVYRTENRGSGPARNYGIYHASGKYIYFPDADDYLEPYAIEILERTMRESDCDLVVFGYKNISVEGSIRSIKNYPKMVKKGDDIRRNYTDYMTTVSKYGIQGAPWNKFFNLELIKKEGVLYPALRRHQDEAFIARYMTYAKNVCFIPEVLYTYYTNDLIKEWDKYPIDYIEAVKGLYEDRKKNILIWSSVDNSTHDLISKEYICNIIKSLELSFSPKFGLNKEKRMNWIIKNIKNSKINEINVPNCLGRYQSLIINLIRQKKYKKMYICLACKVTLQKKGMLKILKK